ncbi:beta-N-acetylhexosaminidase [Anaerocolumna sp. MB42-C2]|uniref:beta-N-acetylhexosaminidase n=1 Tax=Anaerocolumna sp. MB42-C2 TaxID=3070997 RepID=UPI0027E1759A|nr:beta-N-acetylhexosaminidase [Anaerocolumna sp. MB42-C2]WMJ86948.1 beta-N-acetylhexosaminidase [Anaerocolumna sp. MB42-C2]
MKPMTLREKIGHMIMTGFNSEEVTPEILQLIDEYKVSNIILFSYNLNNRKQIAELCRELNNRICLSTGYPGMIATDQEGGVVTRLPEESPCIPGAMLIGATGKKEYAYEAGKITGAELKALGINMDLAPVLDINSNPGNPVIGARAYSGDGKTVKEYGVAMMRGLLEKGVAATAKHFPGHGDTSVDSHLGLPVVEKGLEELMEQELIPFQSAIKNGIPCIMTSHILFPKLEEKKLPATMSKSILTGLLRDKLGFQGVIITDCLEMGAIKDNYKTTEGAVKAVKAGAELLCISHTPELVIKAIEKIEEAVLSGEIPMEQIDRAVDDILKLKEKYQIEANNGKSKNAIRKDENTKDAKQIIKEIALSGITWLSDAKLPEITPDTIFLGSFAYRSTLASSIADSGLHFAKYMAEKMNCSYLNVSINPDIDERTRILQEVKGYSRVVYGLYNGHLNKGQIELANEISRSGQKILGITLRNPYDLAFLDKAILKMAAYEYNTTVFDALVKILKKQEEPRGKLPVELTKV